MPRDRLSIQITMDRKRKDHILETYKEGGFNMARRIEKLILADIADIERRELGGGDEEV